MKRLYLPLVFGVLMTFLIKYQAFAQIDSLIFNNGNIIVGEIKSMDKGIIQIETDYSDSDFKIEWEKISRIKTESHFLVTLEDGTKYYNTPMSSINDSIVAIITEGGQAVSCNIDRIVYLNPIKDKFLDRLSASIDIGYSLTKANNLQQFTSNSGIAYTAEKWSVDLSFNSLRSTQDETEDIARSEGKSNFRYVLPRRFYIILTVSLLSDTEQKLDLRSNTQLGLGNFLLRTNRSYWGAKLGVNRNLERYTSEADDRNSWEGYFGTELDLYDIGDFSLLTNIMAYPSITEVGRWRLESNLNIKYDLPLDFYIKFGGSLNYDNRPAEGASPLGYTIQTGIGWEWN